MVDPMLLCVNIYHANGGDRDAAATMMGISSTTGIVLATVMLPLGAWLSEKIGKRSAITVHNARARERSSGPWSARLDLPATAGSFRRAKFFKNRFHYWKFLLQSGLR